MSQQLNIPRLNSQTAEAAKGYDFRWVVRENSKRESTFKSTSRRYAPP